MLVCIARTYFYCRGLHCIVQSDILHNTQVPEGFVNLNVGLLNIQGNNFSQLQQIALGDFHKRLSPYFNLIFTITLRYF